MADLTIALAGNPNAGKSTLIAAISNAVAPATASATATSRPITRETTPGSSSDPAETSSSGMMDVVTG